MARPIKPSKHDHLDLRRGPNEHAAADAIRQHVDKRAAATERRTGHGLGVARLLGARAKAATKRPHL